MDNKKILDILNELILDYEKRKAKDMSKSDTFDIYARASTLLYDCYISAFKLIKKKIYEDNITDEVNDNITDEFNMIPVQSSNLSAIGYNKDTKVLKINFKGSGEYLYHDVSPELYDEFLVSESKGKFFSMKIKNIHVFNKLR